jgi:hypothetical protein
MPKSAESLGVVAFVRPDFKHADLIPRQPQSARNQT